MELGFDFWIQLIVVLGCLIYAAPKGGITLGLMGGVGLVILCFGFGLIPGKPPVDVILTIIAVICASSAMQSAGGLNCLLQIAEKLLRKHPKSLCYLAPYTCWMLTVLCGSGHIVYTMLPIIYDVAIRNNIRPERPMAASTIASQMGIICSPAAVASVSIIALLEGVEYNGMTFGFIELFSIVIPSAIVGLFLVGTFSMFRGKDLDKDEQFQALIADPEKKKYVYGETSSLIGVKFTFKQWLSLYIFIGTVAVVAVLGAVPSLRPLLNDKPMSMTLVIQMMMLLAGMLMVIFCDAKNINKSNIFSAGMVAAVSVYGVAWMADTFFDNHLEALKLHLTDLMMMAPWAYGLVLLIVSKFVNSQAAAIMAVTPVALAIGTPPGIVVAMASACYGYYILPTYPSDLAAITFDRSGTTHIGKFLINHSFILPGLIGVLSATTTGYCLGAMLGYF